MSKEAKVLIGIAVLVIIGGVLLAIFANPQPEQPGAPVDSQALVRENSHMTGKKDAKVTVVEFGDFQCPACAAAFPEMKAVMDQFKDNPEVNFVFRNFPLDAIHPNAQVSAEAAEASGKQGKFWEMSEILYARQSEWSQSQTAKDIFAKYAEELGLNVDEFKVSVEQRLSSNIISTDAKDGASVGVNSTPTFFINGVKQSKVLQRDELKALIDAELAK